MSIIGIGTDIVKISRITKTLERFGERFIQRNFTEAEYQLAQQRGTDRRLAMFFAAKEAASKAMGTGFVGFSMKEIEVIYLDSGKPNLVLHSQAAVKASSLGISHFHLSLTDDSGIAMAFVVAE